MVNIYTIVNKLLRTRGNVIKVRFSVGNKLYEAYVPDDERWGSIKDILLNREYEYVPLFSIENLKGFTVIDVGAHVGLYSLVVSDYARRIISIEPHPVNYRLLEINRIVNNIEAMTTLNVAVVGTKANSVKLCEGCHSGGSSIVIESSSRCYQIQAITLNELIENYVANSRVLLKMDIEGAEFNVFKTIDLDLLRSIERIVMEIHLRYGSLDIIVDKLKSAGFTVSYFYPPLIAKEAKPPIRVQNMAWLKILRSAIYSIAKLGKLKDRDLVILFAWRHR